jgi:hypothetical protein
MIPGYSYPVYSVAPVTAVQSYTVGSHTYGVSSPKLVSSNNTFLHFPTISRLSSGRIKLTCATYPDSYSNIPSTRNCWSDNGGATWTATEDMLDQDMTRGAIQKADGGLIAIPTMVHSGVGNNCTIPRICTYALKSLSPVVSTGSITGLAHPMDPLSGDFVGNFWGDIIPAVGGGWLTCYYGKWQSESTYTLFMLKSLDGYTWDFQSIVCPSSYHPPPGTEGPDEFGLVRISNGNLLVVFRTGGNTPISQVTSADDGLTWDTPVQTNLGVVSPYLIVLPDWTILCTSGYALNSGHFWMHASADSGSTWALIYDLWAHHNAHCSTQISTSSGYTAFVKLDATHLLVVYDDDNRSQDPHPSAVWSQRIVIS